MTSRNRFSSVSEYIRSTIALDHRVDAVALRLPPNSARSSSWIGSVSVEVLGEDVLRRLGVRPLDLDLHVEPAGPQDRRVDHVLAVGGADDDDVLQALDAVDLARAAAGTIVVSTSEETPEPRVRKIESISSKNTITGVPVAGLLPGALEDQPDVPLGLADVLVEQLGALDVEEERPALVGSSPRTAATFLASELATALAMSVLPQPGGP